MPRYGGTGVIADSDYKDIVKWVGKTKSGKKATIIIKDAINLGNIDWTMADKDEVIAQIVMTATYSNTDETATDTKEPWEVEIEGEKVDAGAAGILLGVGIFCINDVKVGLNRGGGKFMVERAFRQIVADGDRGPVKGRITIDESKASLTMNAMQILTNMKELYTAIEELPAEAQQAAEKKAEEPGAAE